MAGAMASLDGVTPIAADVLLQRGYSLVGGA